MGVSHIYILGWDTAHKFQTLPNYKKLFMPVILKHFSSLESYKNHNHCNYNDVNVLLFYSYCRRTQSLVYRFSKSLLRLAIWCLDGDSDHVRGFVPLQDNTGKWKHP